MTATRPLDRHTIAALRVVGRVLGSGAAWQSGGRFYFEMGSGWLLCVSPDSADRFRLSACYGLTEVDTLWCIAGDLGRLADLVAGLRTEIAAFAA